jgi:hypothetical protein
MGFVAIDTQGARRLGGALGDAAAGAEQTRRAVINALSIAELKSLAPSQIAIVQEGLQKLGAGVIEKAQLAERFTVDPKGVAAGLDAPVAELASALTGLVGFTGPSSLRSVFTGLPASGTDPALDAAVGRLSPVLLPALMAGQKPELDEAQLNDLRTLALSLGIRDAGSLLGAAALAEANKPIARSGSFFRRLVAKDLSPRDNTEVFWNDFWADGRTVDQVLADPAQLLEWVSGSFELDRRLAVSTELPGLVDVLQSVDFARGAESTIETLTAEAEASFAAITTFLPAVLAGQDRTPPSTAQLEQTLAFAARVGWTDPLPTTATPVERFASAVAFLKANRALGSALLPTAFEGSPQPLVFFDRVGIALQLDLGRRVGVVTDASLASLDQVAGQIAASAGLDLSAATPPAVDDERIEQIFGALLASQVPQAFLQTPGLQPRFDAALTQIRNAATGPEARRRIAEAVAAFRTLAVTGPAALTERQLTAIVGPQLVGTLGSSRLRLRDSSFFQKNPEFLLVTQTWGVPGGHKETIGKYKFTWSFDGTGALTAIRRKKKSTLSRLADTFKAIGKAIVTSFKENPLKAIFQVGKIAVSVLALVFPGTQALGAAALALNVGDAVLKATEGDWLGALTSGLSAFTAGATDVFGVGIPTGLDIFQQNVANNLLGDDLLGFVKNAKRAVDIGTAVIRAMDADSLVGAIGAGLGAGAFALGSGGELLGSIGAINSDLTDGLVRLGKTLLDVTKIVAPAAGLIDAIDRNDTGAAIANGLGVISGGAKALGNPDGAFSPTAPGVDTLFEFDKATQENLLAIAKGTGIASLVTRAVQAADRGESFAASSLLTQALLQVNDPLKTPLGNRALVAQRLADVAAVIESIVDRGGDPTRAGAAAAPIILQRLQLLLDAANTEVRVDPPVPTRNPLRVERDRQARTGSTAGSTATIPPRLGDLPIFGAADPVPSAPGALPSIFDQLPSVPVPSGLPSALTEPSGAPSIPVTIDDPVPLAASAVPTVFATSAGEQRLSASISSAELAELSGPTTQDGPSVPLGLAGFASPGQQVQGTPFSSQGFQMDWYARYITDQFVSFDDVVLDSGVPGLATSTADIPGLVLPTPEPLSPRSRPFDMIRPRTALPEGDPLVGELTQLSRRRPEITPDPVSAIPIIIPGKEPKIEILPRTEDGKIVGTKDETSTGETTFTMERQGSKFIGGIIPFDADWGTTIGVSRTVVDGTVPAAYLPTFGRDLKVGEGYALWINNELRGKVAAGGVVDVGYQQGRRVEVQRVDQDTLEITVFPEVVKQALAGGGGARGLDVTVGGERTFSTGEKYVVPFDQPEVNQIAYNLLRDGGASMTPPHSLVTRSEGAFTGAAEFLTVGKDGKLPTGQQTETHTRFDDSSELVTGEVVYPGVKVTYSYPVTVDGKPGPMQNVRLEYLDPELPDKLGPNVAGRMEQQLTEITPLPSPVPKEGIQLSISPDNALTGADFVGTILVQTPGSAARQVPVAVTLEQYRTLFQNPPGGMQAAVNAYLKETGLEEHGVGTAGALAFIERAKAAFSRFDLDRPDHPAISWNAAVHPTPPPGTVVTDVDDPVGTDAVVAPDPELPALFQPPVQHWVPGTTADIDWGGLANSWQDLPGGGHDSATVPDPWTVWDGEFAPLPDYSSIVAFGGPTFDDGYSLQDPLDSFSVIPNWDAGTNFDDAWADAWNSPTEYSDSDSYVSEYL